MKKDKNRPNPDQPRHVDVLNQRFMIDQWVEENIFGYGKKSLIHWISTFVAWPFSLDSIEKKEDRPDFPFLGHKHYRFEL